MARRLDLEQLHQSYRRLPEEELLGELFGLRATTPECPGLPTGGGGGAWPLGFGVTVPELRAVARGGAAWRAVWTQSEHS